jgi:hypothetical protein
MPSTMLATESVTQEQGTEMQNVQTTLPLNSSLTSTPPAQAHQA